jgi:hypothetical protein
MRLESRGLAQRAPKGRYVVSGKLKKKQLRAAQARS